MTVPTFVAGVALTAAQLNLIRDDVNPTAWTAVTFLNSWVNHGGANQACAYRKVGDVVEIRGLAKSGTITQAVFTLPAGFRPPGNLFFASNSNDAFGSLAVQSGGNVVAAAGSNVFFSLNCEFSVTA